MKTLLLPKNLANEKKGGLCKTPHAVILRRNAPPPPWPQPYFHRIPFAVQRRFSPEILTVIPEAFPRIPEGTRQEAMGERRSPTHGSQGTTGWRGGMTSQCHVTVVGLDGATGTVGEAASRAESWGARGARRRRAGPQQAHGRGGALWTVHRQAHCERYYAPGAEEAHGSWMVSQNGLGVGRSVSGVGHRPANSANSGRSRARIQVRQFGVA